MILSFKFRIKDASSRKHLAKLAIATNAVWNFCANTQREAERRWKGGAKSKWPSHFDLVNLTAGTSSDLGIHSDTINAICGRFVRSRDQHRKCPRFRASFGSNAALGWVPFIPRAIRLSIGAIVYKGRTFRFWQSREIPPDIRAGEFVCDALGRWFVTFYCDVAEDRICGNGKIGIDLGLKSIVTTSDGDSIEAPQIFRKYEAKLAVAQRARNKKRAKAIHAKITACRKDFLHKLSTQLVLENQFIAIGDVSASHLKLTKMAKSVSDAGWGDLGMLLAYKARRHQAVFVKVDERFTTQTCSSCGALPESRPKGIAGLRIREWTCSDCGATHNRDVNAAMNILIFGLKHQPPAEGIPHLEDVEPAPVYEIPGPFRDSSCFR